MLDSVFDVLVIMAPAQPLEEFAREVFAAGGEGERQQQQQQWARARCEEEWLVAACDRPS